MSQHPASTPPTPRPAPPEQPPGKRRRRWPWIVLALLVLVLAFIALAPWLASTAPVRGLLVSQINKRLNGSVSIESYSVGWFGGIDAKNIKVYDAQRALILELDELRTPLSLLGLLRGPIDLGDTVVTVNITRLRFDAEGKPNYLALLPASETSTPAAPTGPGEPAPPVSVPDIRGRLTVNIRGGTIESPQLRQAVHLDPSKIVLTLPGGNEPVSLAVNLGWRSGTSSPASVEASGSVRPFRDGKLDLDALSAELSTSLRNVDLVVLAPIVETALGGGNQLRGIVNGSLSAKFAMPASVSADGAIILDSPAFGGPVLNGDVLSSERITLTTRLGMDDPGGGPVVRIDELSVRSAEGVVVVSGRVPTAAMQNLADGRMPGAEGQLSVQIDAPSLARPISQLRNSLKLAEGVRISDAAYRQAITLRLFPDRVELAQSLSAGASGQRDGQPIRLSPITVESSATLHSLGPNLPDARGLVLKVAAAGGGLGIEARGPNLSGINATGSFDLDRLVQEASQFVDLGPLRARGGGSFTIATVGDPLAASSPVQVNASLHLRDLRLEGIAGLPAVSQPSTTASLATRLLTPAEGQSLPGLIEDVRVTLQSLDERGQPIIDLVVQASGINPASLDVASFELAKLSVPDLAAAQRQVDPFVPALQEAGVRIERGSLAAGVAGRFDGKTRTLTLSKPLTLSAPRVVATLNGASLLDGDSLSATLALDRAVADPSRPAASGVRAQFSVTAANAQLLVEGKLNIASVDVASSSVRGLVVETISVSSLPDVQRRVEAIAPELARSGIKLTDGQLYVALGGSFDGSSRAISLDRPLEVSIPNLSVARVSESGARRNVLAREKLNLRVQGSVSLPDDGVAAELKELRLGAASGLFDIAAKDGQPVRVRFNRVTGPGGSGAVVINADLRRFAEVLQALGGQVAVKNQPGEIRSGTLTTTIAFADQPSPSIAVTGAIHSLTVSSAAEPIENQAVEFDLLASSPANPAETSSLTVSGSVRSPLLAARLEDALLVLSQPRDGKSTPTGTWDLLQRARFELTIPDLPRVQAIANAFTPPASTGGDTPGNSPSDDGSASPVPPLEVVSGSIRARGTLARDPVVQVTRLSIPEASVDSLALRRGEQQYRFDPAKPLAFKVAAEINAADQPKATLLQQIRSIRVTELSGDAQVVSIAMPQPLTLSDLSSDVPSASGTITVAGDLDRAAELLAIVSGGSPLPYGGTISARQQLSTDSGTISLVGNIDIDQLKVRDATDRKKILHTEPKVAVRNSVALLSKPVDVELREVSLTLPASNAVSLSARGAIRSLQTERRFDGFFVDLAYDLEKLWPIIKPMLPASSQKDIEKSEMAGQHQTRIPVTGSFPATDPRTGTPLAFHESIRFVEANGLIAVQLADLFGLRVEGLEVPFVLSNGQVQLIHAGKTGRDRLPRPAAVNGGTLDLGGIVVDLAQPEPRLSVGKNQRLLRQVSINPVLGDTLGKYINPVFPNSKQAKGLLDVTVQYAENVALGEGLKGKDSGRARVVFSLSEMDIANPLGSLLIGGLLQGLGGGGNVVGPQADTFRGQIRDAVITLEAGRTTQDVTLTLVDPDRRDARGNPVSMPLRFTGDIALSDLSQRLSVSLPVGLVTKFIRNDQLERNLNIAFPSGIPLTMTGTTLRPQIDFSGVMQQFIEGQLRGRLVPGGGGSGNPLQDLLRGLEQEKDRNPPDRKPTDRTTPDRNSNR